PVLSPLSFARWTTPAPPQPPYGQGDKGVPADTAVGKQCGGRAAATPCGRSWGHLLPAGTTIYDHANDIYRVGNTLDNGITLAGGNDRTTFYLSAYNPYQRGVMVGPNHNFPR